MSNIRNMSVTNPCPICGKPDWCGWMPANDGGELVICQRNVESFTKGVDGVIGVDGNYYICVGTSKSGSNIFEEAGQRLAKQQMKDGLRGEFKKADIPIRTLTPIDQVEKFSPEKLDVLYNALLDELILEDRHKQMLLDEGWSEDLICKSKIRSFPVEDRIRFQNKYDPAVFSKNPWRKTLGKRLGDKYGSLKGMPGAFQNAKGEWTFAGWDGIVFPVPNVERKIHALRIRLENPVPGKGKYRNFSSFRKDVEAEKQGFLVNKYTNGCRSGNQLGFYYNPQVDDMYCAYITEGEKKAIYSNSVLKNPFICVPGVNSYGKLVEGRVGERPIDALKAKGVKIFVIAYDADKLVNEKVLDSEKRTIELLKKEGFLIGVAEWNAALGKGIDDLLSGGNKPTFVLA